MSTSTSSGPSRSGQARAALGLPVDADVLLFAGRIQPLKAPDVLLRAVAALLEREPGRRSRIVVPIVGGPSGTGLDKPQALADLAAELGLTDVVRFVPPVSQAELAQWYAAATLVAVPSYNESFGLVAVEAEATGTPVVAAAVGGLTTAVRDGHSGLLVPGHHTDDWADALHRVLGDDELRARLEAGARRQAALFSWDATAEATFRVYERARSSLARSRSVTDPAERLRAYLEANELDYDEPQPGQFSFALPGEKKLQTPVRLDIGTHALGVHAFVCRRPDENHERVYEWLLQRNLRLYGVAFAVDRLGDIYLDGRLPLSVIDDDDELDRLLGAVLTTADESFNSILELGFASSIRKEWEWRTPARRVDREPRGVPRLARGRRGLRKRRGPARTRPAPVAPARPGSGG